MSQRMRKLVEEGYGWGKVVGLLWIFAFTNAAYNLVRIRTLIRTGVRS